MLARSVRAVPRLACARQMSSMDAIGSAIYDDSVKPAFARMKMAFSETEALKAKYSTPLPPIDFAAFKAKLPKGAVDAVEAKFKNFKPPTAEEVSVILKEKELKATMAAEIAAAAPEMVQVKAALADQEKMLVDLKATRTNPDTTCEDYLKLYPELGPEIDEEIHNHEWLKDST